jgi:adenine-specific DNA-methyltransferase
MTLKTSPNYTNEFYLLKRSAIDINQVTEKPDLIYIDPPFNLSRRFEMDGGIGFDDFWSNDEEYINWYADILEKCYSILKKNGTIYAHNNFINNALVLSKVSDKVRKSFNTNISWKRSHPHNNIKNGWGNIVDSILVLKKGHPYFQPEYTDLNETYKNGSFGNSDIKGNYSLSPITGEKSRIGHNFDFNGFNPKYGWRKSLDEIQKLHDENLIHYGKNKPYLKKYLSESKGVPVQNFWNDIHPITRSDKNKREYPTQKPLLLLERIIRASCPLNGLVFDPFCGSGTTIMATINVGNRSCITSDISDEALNICAESLRSKLCFPDKDGHLVWPSSNTE